MSTIVTRAGKGSALTHNEVDANFTNLNNDKLEGTVPIANGGTGQTTAQAAINSLAGATTSGQYLRGDGTNVVMSAIQVADVPTLNQNTTGSAGSVTTTNFSVVESGGVLYFKYGATDIAKLDSSGNFTVLANVTAYGTV